ncbi:MAG: DUF2493 domain-containing protein [Pseudomonadota bacterium]
MQKFNSFADLANARIETADTREGVTESYDGAFVENGDMAKLSVVEEPMASEMPDPDMARRAVEMAIGTIFDVLKDTRMEEFAQQLAWGMVNSFHMTARLAEGREDDAAKKLKDLATHFDPSEIYAVELEETQLLVQTLQGCREALEAMRDHASDVYRVETGRTFTATRGSQVSKNGVTASQIQARDYLAARAKDRRAQFQPEGPLVAVSGGMKEWHDFQMIWEILDDIKGRIPNMVLGTTGMRKGVDAMASAWAQKNGVQTILFMPDRTHGNRAPFLRNEKMVKLGPVEAIVCEGSGIQQNLAQRLRQAGVPTHIRRVADQRPQEQRAGTSTFG